jgi:hypothetical protein
MEQRMKNYGKKHGAKHGQLREEKDVQATFHGLAQGL